ncbi:MAG: aspartate aminotransferase family protein [Anaerovoracaceae bacterium]|nr:aspartate aminotransferase family protein [Anaerovoracaceae bacterium]
MLRDSLPKIVTDKVPGPKAQAVIDRRHEATPSAIGCSYPFVPARGEGAMVEDVDGNVFVDWIGGVAVLNMGYTHPDIVQALNEQAGKYFHCMFNIGSHEGYVALAEKMNEIVPVKGDKKRTFFANSGAEANENAVKLAKSFTGRPNVIVFTSAFHGRTSLTMEMSWEKSAARGVGPFPQGVYRAKYPYMYHAPESLSYEEQIDYYIDDLKDTLFEDTLPEYTAAIILEPIIGNGGFAAAPIEWVKKVRELCDEYGIMLIADEIQCGMGRSGKMFVSDYWKEAGAAPDILVTAKSIAGGIPLSSITAREEVVESVLPGVIGGTYCGNALACATALKVFEVMERDDLCGRANHIGGMVLDRYKEWMEKYECIGDVRGVGAMVGIEFVKDRTTKEPDAEIVKNIVSECAQNGLLIEAAGIRGNSIRFMAPLVITDEQIEAGLEIMEAAIKKCM